MDVQNNFFWEKKIVLNYFIHSSFLMMYVVRSNNYERHPLPYKIQSFSKWAFKVDLQFLLLFNMI